MDRHFNYLRKTARKYAGIVSILLITGAAYIPLLNSFFQQDEWNAFGSYYANRSTTFAQVIANAFALKVGHYTPFRDIFYYLLFSIVKTNFSAWVVISVLLHVLTTYLVFCLAKKITKRTNTSYIAALVFGLSAAGSQATTWIVADLNTHGAAIFALISCITYLTFLETGKAKLFWSSIALMFCSLFFKEIAIAFFVLFGLLIYIFPLASNIRNSKRKYTIFISLCIVAFGILKASSFLVPHEPKANQVVTDTEPIKYLVFNLSTFPVKGFVETVIPPTPLVNASRLIARALPVKYVPAKDTTEFDIFSEKIISQSLTVLLFLVFTLLLFKVYKKSKDSKIKKAIIFGTFFVILNAPIYALSPGTSGIIETIDGRNLYFLLVGSVILIACGLSVFSIKKQILIVVFILCANMIWLSTDLMKIVSQGELRHNILNNIVSFNQVLPTKVLFYSESDTSFYGLPEDIRILPFQSGLGQTLLVWYEPTEKFSPEFFRNDFLWDIDSQGYKEVNGRGFGYFRDFSQLTQTMLANNLDKNSVVAFGYDSNTKKLTDTTQEIRGRIDGFLSKKRVINIKPTVTSSQNSKDINAIVDRNRQTSWNSLLPENQIQYVNVDMGRIFTIAQIRLDTYNDQNQGKAGFRVELSLDNNIWTQVFNSKVLPPDKGGITDLYFKPQKARYVRITQIGTHKFATWVINEINLYEAVDR